MPGENLPTKLLVYDMESDTLIFIHKPRMMKFSDLPVSIQERILENYDEVPDRDQMVLY